ncbi:hypothetical protein K435DRAFT_656667, partial [Dendrothele bispora CBS 962.96]
NADINAGFRGKFVWLIPKRTNDGRNAGTYIQIQITENAIPNKVDMAAGADGKYRHLTVLHDADENEKITKVALYRKSNGEGRVTLDDAVRIGFNRVSTDINAGRGGDFLHLIFSVSS